MSQSPDCGARSTTRSRRSSCTQSVALVFSSERPMALTSVRARLTLWHAAVLTLIVCTFAAGSLLFVRARLYADLDAQLGRELSVIDRVYREEPGELGDLPKDRGFLYFQINENASLRHQSDGWKQIAFPVTPVEPASW